MKCRNCGRKMKKIGIYERECLHCGSTATITFNYNVEPKPLIYPTNNNIEVLALKEDTFFEDYKAYMGSHFFEITKIKVDNFCQRNPFEPNGQLYKFLITRLEFTPEIYGVIEASTIIFKYPMINSDDFIIIKVSRISYVLDYVYNGEVSNYSHAAFLNDQTYYDSAKRMLKSMNEDITEVLNILRKKSEEKQ